MTCDIAFILIKRNPEVQQPKLLDWHHSASVENGSNTQQCFSKQQSDYILYTNTIYRVLKACRMIGKIPESWVVLFSATGNWAFM